MTAEEFRTLQGIHGRDWSDVTDEEIESLINMLDVKAVSEMERLLEEAVANGLVPAPVRPAREIEYDEVIKAFPTNLTPEDFKANHAAGLPVTRERIVRCKDCDYFKANSDTSNGGGFCRVWARPRRTDSGFCDHGLKRPSNGTSWDDILKEGD